MRFPLPVIVSLVPIRSGGVVLYPGTREIARGPKIIRLSPRLFWLAAILFGNQGKPLSTPAIVDLLYADDWNGGCLSAINAVRRFNFELRARLNPLNLTVVASRGIDPPRQVWRLISIADLEQQEAA